MSKLIALVTVAVLVEGVRQEFPPGSELPDLPAHDVQELKRMNAVEDVAETAATEKAQAKADAKAGADFERERNAIQAANASTQTDGPTGDAVATPAAKTAATPAAKKR